MLLNFSQSLGIHGCDNGCRIFEVECTGDPKTELYSDVNNKVLDGKLLYKLYPQLRPGYIIRVKVRDQETGKVNFSGYSYTVVAGNNHKANGAQDGFVYAVCHRDDEQVKFFQVDSIGDQWRYEMYVPQMSLFTTFGGILLDNADVRSAFDIYDGTDTNSIVYFTDGVRFNLGAPSGKTFSVFNHYYSNKFIVKHTVTDVGNFNKRFVFYYVFKPKEYLEHSYLNSDEQYQFHTFLNEVCICGRLKASPVRCWNIGAIRYTPKFFLRNGTISSTLEYSWGADNFEPVANDNALYKGTFLTWFHASGGNPGLVLDGYTMLFFDPIP